MPGQLPGCEAMTGEGTKIVFRLHDLLYMVHMHLIKLPSHLIWTLDKADRHL